MGAGLRGLPGSRNVPERVPLLQRLLRKNNPHEERVANLRRKMQIGLQLLLFQAVEGLETAPLRGLALEWAPGTC